MDNALPDSNENKAIVVGIKFRNNARVYDYLTDELKLSIGDACAVEAEKGVAYGEVADRPRFLPCCKLRQPLRKVIRVVNKEDNSAINEKRALEKEAYEYCLSKVVERGLKMKLVAVEFLDDQHKVIFYFTSVGRVDFRDLVKDLAHKFKIRIEMRQIGVRDEAKILGGLGPCGRKLCCTTFLNNLDPVTIRMAKDQDLTLNPSKISGLCGRLMCCLGYEHDSYKTLKVNMPYIGDRLTTPGGEGVVIKVNILQEKAVLEMEDGRKIEVKCEDFCQWKKIPGTTNSTAQMEAPGEENG